MFTYVALITVTEEGRKHAFAEAPEYLEKIRTIVVEEGGELERVLAIMGPWDYLAVAQYPDNEAAFRALGKIAELKWLKTETFVAEDVEVFFKAFA